MIEVTQAGGRARRWTANHSPAANTQATVTRAAAAGGMDGVPTCNVCTGITVVVCAGASAPTAVVGNVALIDGASGGTTILWKAAISIPAVAGAMNGIVVPVMYRQGSPGTAMTLEFNAALGANTTCSVDMEGSTV